MVHTLITGGSMGYGRSLAIACARRGMNLFLVALPGPELEETARQISSEFHVDVRFLAIDLTALDAPEKLYTWCCDQNLEINCIINDAGLAGAALFEESSVKYSDARIMLNVRALTLVCKYFIPMLRQHSKSYILNVGSLAAYFPIPYKSVYSATKAYVLNFSKSLAVELKPFGIQVSVVCPNGIETNPGTIARTKAHKKWGKWTKMDSEKLAHFTIEKMLQGKRVIIPKLINKFLLVLRKLVPPSFLMWILEREFRAEPRSN